MSVLQGKKLAIVVNDPAFFLSHRLNLARAAQNAGMVVSVCTPSGESVRQIQSLGISHESFSLSRWGANPFFEGRSLGELVRLYKTLKPDIVHHVTIKPVIYGSIAARIAGVPGVVNAISGLGQVFTSSGFKAGIRRQIVQMLYRFALSPAKTRVIFQNTDDRRAFLDAKLVAESKTALIRGAGVNLAELKPSPEPQGRVDVLFASRLLREKGVEEFVEAARLLRKRGINARFIVAGTPIPGNPGSVSAAQFDSWKASGDVELLGHQADMAKLLRQVHIVCLPSYYGEGVPKILIEAAASGRAIVTTDWPGCRDIVSHGDNGLLVAPRNVTALAAALEKLIGDSVLRNKMGERGRIRVETEGFGEEHVVAQTLRIYSELAA
jgi:glycosyltransferase involved in cell wall biosynthesis